MKKETNVFLHPDETWDRVLTQLTRIENLIKDCGSEIKRISSEQVFQSERIQKLGEHLEAVKNELPFCTTPQ